MITYCGRGNQRFASDDSPTANRRETEPREPTTDNATHEAAFHQNVSKLVQVGMNLSDVERLARLIRHFPFRFRSDMLRATIFPMLSNRCVGFQTALILPPTN
jgi:hypothetical protein